MQSMRVKNRLLIGYFLIAYIFVQSISGFLHVHWHDPAQEPDVIHHHYPVSSILGEKHNVAEHSQGLIKLDLQSDSLFGSKMFPPILAILLLTLLLPMVVLSPVKWHFSTTIAHSSQRRHYRTPPLRAPPLLKI